MTIWEVTSWDAYSRPSGDDGIGTAYRRTFHRDLAYPATGIGVADLDLTIPCISLVFFFLISALPFLVRRALMFGIAKMG